MTEEVVSDAARQTALRQWEEVDQLPELPSRDRLAAGRVHNSEALSPELRAKIARLGEAHEAANEATAAFVEFSATHLPYKAQRDEVYEEAAAFLSTSRRRKIQAARPSALDRLVDERRRLHRAAGHAIGIANSATEMVRAGLVQELQEVEESLTQRVEDALSAAQDDADRLCVALANVANLRGEVLDLRNATYPSEARPNDSHSRLIEACNTVSAALAIVGGRDEQ